MIKKDIKTIIQLIFIISFTMYCFDIYEIITKPISIISWIIAMWFILLEKDS